MFFKKKRGLSSLPLTPGEAARRSAFGLAAAAEAALAFTAQMPLASMALAGATLAGVWLGGEKLSAWLSPRRARGAGLIALAAGIARAWVGGVFDGAIHLLLFLLPVKLAGPRRPGDFRQILAICLLLFLGAATVTESLAFAAIFPVFLLFGVTALAQLTAHRDYLATLQEGAWGLRHSSQNIPMAARLPRRGATRHWLRLGGLAFGATALLFALIPRFSSNAFFFRWRKPAQTVSGFSDRIDPRSEGGRLELDASVALRARMVQGTDVGSVRLRGTALDLFDGVSWTCEPRPAGLSLQAQRSDLALWTFLGHSLPVAGGPARERWIIRFEGEPSSYLFVPYVPMAFWDLGQLVPLARDDNLGAFILREFPPRLEYEVEFKRVGGEEEYRELLQKAPPVLKALVYNTQGSDEDIRRKASQTIRHFVDRNVGLPESIALNSALRDLAEEMSEEQTDPLAAAMAIRKNLRRRCVYVLDLPPATDAGGRSPVERFLLETKRGHCEEFASAMAVLLRLRGIPARVAVGYHSAERNGLTDEYVIRRSHAHAWAEVFFPEHGWLPFDPTPEEWLGGGRANRAALGWAAQWSRHIVEALAELWRRHVVDYDFSRQRFLYGSFWTLRRTARAMTSPESLARGWTSAQAGAALLAAGLVLAWAMKLAGQGARRAWARKRYRSASAREAARLMRKLRGQIARRAGWAWPEALSAGETARLLPADSPERADFEEFARWHAQARFGGVRATFRKRREIRRLARSLMRRLSQR
jgi:transglutaminase-like putative cysteine protease